MSATNLRRAVFLDRDGTLMEEVHYCGDPAQVRVYPGVPEALRKLKEAGFRTFVITNQSAIGRGLFTESQYRAVESEFLRQIGEGLLDASYFCPDVPGLPSTRRKPEIGMLLEAAADFDIDLAGSYMVGDKIADIECGRRAGTSTILVRTGYGANQACRPDFTVDNVVAAIQLVLLRENVDRTKWLPML
jgi:D-glycero-D-manno-heptose 1,7-bisphosphate phosphatase